MERGIFGGLSLWMVGFVNSGLCGELTAVVSIVQHTEKNNPELTFGVFVDAIIKHALFRTSTKQEDLLDKHGIVAAYRCSIRASKLEHVLSLSIVDASCSVVKAAPIKRLTKTT